MKSIVPATVLAIALLVTGACGPAPGDGSASCVLAEPACSDCFLLLAAFDRFTTFVDTWYAFDGATMVEFDPPDGDHSGVAVTADGVGVFLHTPFFATEMRYYLFDAGAWDEGHPIGFEGTGNTLATDGRCVHLLYADGDDRRRHAIFDGTSWHAGEALPIAPGSQKGNLAARDGELVHVFLDAADTLTTVTRTTTWQTPQVLGDVAGTYWSPSIAALRSGAEFIVVYRGLYATREAGEWTALSAIPSPGPILLSSVTALRDGRALVVWEPEGLDVHHIFYSMYDPVARTWTPPIEYLSGPVEGSLSVAAGAAGQEFFLAYTHDDGDHNLLLRFDGADVELLLSPFFERDISLASNP